VRKAAFRAAGTLAGVVAGDGLAHLIGIRPVPAPIVIILAAFFMVYFAGINYDLPVFAVTVSVTQFYTQMGELSSALLTTRVEKIALTVPPRRALEPTSRSSPDSPAALHRWP
jgi:uncharacterized membrane protein YccC